jgi:hypothetical protein
VYALIVEIDNPVVGALEFKRDPTDLLAFMSFAIAEPLGSQHPLTNLARRLKKDFDINLTPLLTFYDNDIEDDVDAINLEAAWQDAAALSICITEIQTVLEKDERSTSLLSGFETIPQLLDELAKMAAIAVQKRGRIRISFRLT